MLAGMAGTDRPRALIVDDEDAFRSLLAELLAAEGYDVDAAASGAEALTKAQQEPDLIFVDLKMPDMDGYETIKRLRGISAIADVPVIVLTSSNTREDRLKAVETGANDFIVKPLDREELRVRSRAQLGLSPARRRRLAKYKTLAAQRAAIGAMVGGALSESSRPRLMIKIRRVGLFIGLFILLTLGAVYWISQDIEAAVTAKLPKAVMVAGVTDALSRLGAVLVLAGVAMAVVIAVSLLAIGRFVRFHFAEIEDANQRKSRLVRWVSHELKTPLNGIGGFADILASGAQGALAPEQAGSVGEIRGGVKHMRAMIADLLDLARIEAGTIELKLEDVSVASVLAEALTVAKPMADQRKVMLVPSGDLSAEMHADFGRMKQVVLNLVSNAIKFTPPDSRISITAAALKGEVRITVADAGPGITPEDQGKLFEEFGQVGAVSGEGTGLGLAISRRLVELHHGRIWIESFPGEGTKFHVSLPAATPLPAPAVRPAAAGV